MKVKTNIRAGQGGSTAVVDTSVTSNSNSTSTGGSATVEGGNSNKPVKYYSSPRCAGI